ncbi:MAG TPA: site-specific integrase [Noviherbaspirillum sp.]|uniref:site-specific integrase n=1 Tax=Noviherbaspirillum sp. TaxID=1926288 RepID=UPI002B460200|nr:site-specific integrase [Noviherbaspirillum sp.]HJV84495.1 site-specific integrase [Noviherbaspirillum sp.]
MAAITKRKSGYQAEIRRKGFPTVSKVFGSRRDAEAWSRRIESEMDQRCFVDRTEAEKTTLGDVLCRYKCEITPKKKSADSEALRISKFLRDEKICAYKVSALNGKLLADWRDRRLLEVSGSSVNRELNLISHALNIARKEWGIHVDNPVSFIQRPKHNKPRERRLSAQEKDVLLLELKLSCRRPNGTFKAGGSHNPWVLPVVLFALETAMRMGEILSLRWVDIDLSKRVAILHDTKNGERRAVPLSTSAIEGLSGLPRSIDGRVFPITREALKRAFSRACERAGVQDLHFHDLRHEATSSLFEKGLNMMEVAAITGHKTFQMLKRYTHLKAEDLAVKLG